MPLGLVATFCAFAITATPALAKEFTASRLPTECSEAAPCKTKGYSIGGEYAQVFHFGNFHIKCDKANAYAKTIPEGAVTWSTSQTFATEVKFGKCLTEAHFGSFVGGLKTSFNEGNPIKFLYHVQGFVEGGSGEVESAVEVGSGDTTFSISGKICKISWPAQTIFASGKKTGEEGFSAALYSTNLVPVSEEKLKKFPSGFQEKLVIADSFVKMEWHYEEGQCLGEGGFEEGAEKEEGKNGEYHGTIEDEVVGGNLGFRE